MDPEKYAALKEYFSANQYAVTEYTDHKPGITQFLLPDVNGHSPLVAIADEFVGDFSATEILDRLRELAVLEKALAEPDKLVVVTQDGVELKPRG
jgi:hypothetical protein